MDTAITFFYNAFFFLLALSILIAFHEFGHFWAARRLGVKVLKFSLGFGPKLVSRTYGDTEYLISALPLGGYVKLFGEEPEEDTGTKSGNRGTQGEGSNDEGSKILSPEDKARSFSHQPVWKRIVIVAAGPVFNLILAYFIFAGSLAIGVGMYVPSFESLMPVAEKVVKNSPAESAGMKPGDRILSINDKKISTWMQMTEIIYGKAGEALTFVVERDGIPQTLTITPEPKSIETRDGETVEVGQIGIGKEPRGVQIQAENPGEAIIMGFQATWAWTYLTVEGLVRLVQGKLSLDNIGGPILIGKLSGEAASQGPTGFFFLIAILSITLGVINILPIPVLDGGHLMFFAIEAVMGRPLSLRKREVAQQFGLVMLLLLMSLAFYNDFVRIFGNSG